jgi:uncharacterized protein
MSMLLDLSRLRGGVERVSRKCGLDEFQGLSEDFRVVAPVELEAEIRREGQQFRLVGRLSTTLECACSRCLDPFTIPVQAALDTVFLPAAANAGAPEQEIADEDLGVSFYRDDVIDLGELMREQFYLALPMKPLCRAECLGICPVCGNNRNVEPCTCQTEWVDPRFEGLKQWRA